MEIAFLYVPVPDHECGLRIARTLVAERLAACANLLPETTSVYFWEGVLRTDSEQVLILKTRSELADAACVRVADLHPYECPSITIWSTERGHPPFFDWIFRQTRTEG